MSYFGIPTRNGPAIGVGSGVAVALSGVLNRVPRSLFLKSEPGAWYDPSEAIGTWYQDSTGVTPVTAVEQPVGLMLDKRLGLVRGPEVWSNTGNTISGEASVVSPGVFRIFSSAGALSAVSTLSATLVGKWYELLLTVDSVTTAGGGVTIDAGAGTASFTTTGAKRTIFQAVSTSVTVKRVSTACDIQVSNISVKLLDGNHARQATSAARPVLKATANIYSMLFDGVDDSLTSATGGGATAGYFLCQAIKPTGGAGTVRKLWSDRVSASFTGISASLNAANKLELNAGNGTAYTTATSIASVDVGTTSLITVWDDGTNLNAQIGSGAIAQIARPTVVAGTAGFTIGKVNGSAANFFTGDIYASVYRTGTPITAAERANIQAYCRSRAGL